MWVGDFTRQGVYDTNLTKARSVVHPINLVDSKVTQLKIECITPVISLLY